MLRPLSCFLLLFSLLSLMVNLNGMFEALAFSGLAGFLLEAALSRGQKLSRGTTREQLFL